MNPLKLFSVVLSFDGRTFVAKFQAPDKKVALAQAKADAMCQLGLVGKPNVKFVCDSIEEG